MTTHAKMNKMNSYNIAVVIGPNIFPVNEKVAPKNKLMVKKVCDIIKVSNKMYIFILNASYIGIYCFS